MNMRRPDNRGRGQIVEEARNNMRRILDRQEDPHGELLVNTADNLGRYLAIDKRMTTSQIRKIYMDMKKIDFTEDGPYKTNILRAKLAYAGRHRQVQDLQEVLDVGLREVGTSKEKFERFLDFFEAIVAYHRRYGGNE
ncbi:MAG: type III-A CRISPR-associated protein Csm2 [Syntrophomonadaceae bacterium]